MGRRRQRLPAEPVTAEIEGWSDEGRGIARVSGKTVFVHGALPGETVRFRYTGRRRQYDEADVLEVKIASDERVQPRCKHFGYCGGCSLQHLASNAQIRRKEQFLVETLEHLGKIKPQEVFRPLLNDTPWGYRRKARLGVKFVPKKGRVLVGFRERGSSFVADLHECHVLHPKVAELLADFSELVAGLSKPREIPQIEVAMDDERLALIFRFLYEPTEVDVSALRQFAGDKDVVIYIQTGGVDTVTPIGSAADLRYGLPEFDLSLAFLPTDFTQVNSEINRQMVARAVELLDLTEDDRVIDFFCGIGNFTLPVARQAGVVVGVEGEPGLVQRARDNASGNNISNAEFFTTNLYDTLDAEPWLLRQFTKALIDPPRTGAAEILPYLPKLGVQRIVYVSCYPGTLAEDAGELVNTHGYRLMGAGIMDMFPHTSHVESIAVFERDRDGH